MTRPSSVVLSALIVCFLAATILAQTPRTFAPARGEAEIAVIVGKPKVEKDMVITAVRVKNMMPNNSIAGLKVEEFWYDGKNPVTGGSFRLKKPLQPGEIETMTIQTQKVPNMLSNSYLFSHANGKIKIRKGEKF